MSTVLIKVVPIPSTPIVDVLLPLPVICAHLSVPRPKQLLPDGILAGPWPPQSESMSPSLVELT